MLERERTTGIVVVIITGKALGKTIDNEICDTEVSKSFRDFVFAIEFDEIGKTIYCTEKFARNIYRRFAINAVTNMLY